MLRGGSAQAVTTQGGVPGAWLDRLPHFRMAFTPSNGEELQSEYFVAREHALEAIARLRRISSAVRPAARGGRDPHHRRGRPVAQRCPGPRHRGAALHLGARRARGSPGRARDRGGAGAARGPTALGQGVRDGCRRPRRRLPPAARLRRCATGSTPSGSSGTPSSTASSASGDPRSSRAARTPAGPWPYIDRYGGHDPARRRQGAGMTSRPRRIGGIVLLVLAALLVPVAVIATWTARTVTDTDAFVARVAPVASSPEVQALIEQEMTAQVPRPSTAGGAPGLGCHRPDGRPGPRQGAAARPRRQPRGAVETRTASIVAKVVEAPEFANAFERPPAPPTPTSSPPSTGRPPGRSSPRATR